MYHVAVCEGEAAIREDISRRCSDILTGLDVPHDMRAFSAAEELKRHNKDKVVAFQDRGRIVRLPAPDIRYLESFEHGVRVHTASETLYFFIPLSQAKDMLPPGMFARCHNSFVVNLAHIKTASSTKVIFSGGEELPVGRTYRDEFHKIFIDHFF